MRKVVSTEMSADFVEVSISVYPDDGGSSVCGGLYRFQTELVNPRVALQIATLLTSDPTVPQIDKKCEVNCESKEE